MLADEPTGSLDTVAGSELMNLLKELNQSQGTTFVVVTHDLNVARQTRRVLVMEDGRIVREDIIGSPIEEDLKVLSHSELGRRVHADDPRNSIPSPPQRSNRCRRCISCWTGMRVQRKLDLSLAFVIPAVI